MEVDKSCPFCDTTGQAEEIQNHVSEKHFAGMKPQNVTLGIMAELMDNPGLCHIVQKISSFLDVRSLSQCRLVSQSWKNLIDNDRPWLTFQIEFIHGQIKKGKSKIISKEKYEGKTIKELFPEWISFTEQNLKKLSLPKLKYFVIEMWNYLKNEEYICNPFHFAVYQSNVSFVQILIDAGIDLSMKTLDGLTPFHLACGKGKLAMVELMIKYAPTFDETLTTNSGSTIFHIVTYNQDPQVLRLIFDKFKFEDIPDKQGRKMFPYAVGFGSKQTIQYLIESRQEIGFNMEERFHNQGLTILHVACGKRDIDIVDYVSEALYKIGSNINFDIQDFDGSTPLHYACLNKTSDVAIQLLQRFPQKIDVLGLNGAHILHYACQFGHLDLLKYIFENPNFNIDFNVPTQNGSTPLHSACSGGQYEVVKFLFKIHKAKGIDVTKQTNEHQTAEDLARQNGHENILEALKIWTLKTRKERKRRWHGSSEN